MDHIYHMQRDIKTTTDTYRVILHTLITSITWQWRPIMNETNDKETILLFSFWIFYLHVPIFQQNLHMESLICIHIIWLYLMSWVCRFGKFDLSLLFFVWLHWFLDCICWLSCWFQYYRCFTFRFLIYSDRSVLFFLYIIISKHLCYQYKDIDNS